MGRELVEIISLRLYIYKIYWHKVEKFNIVSFNYYLNLLVRYLFEFLETFDKFPRLFPLFDGDCSLDTDLENNILNQKKCLDTSRFPSCADSFMNPLQVQNYSSSNRE